MPRQPLREISGNSNYRGGIEGRFELTPNWRSHIVGRAAAGQCQKAISEALNIPWSTVQYMINQADSRYENESLHWSSRPRIVSEALCCCIVREACVNPKIWYTDLWCNLDLHEKAVSKTTLYCILKNEGITNWMAKRRLLLTSEITAKCLKFAEEHEDWNSEKWKIFL